jgi:hypothetical protein
MGLVESPGDSDTQPLSQTRVGQPKSQSLKTCQIQNFPKVLFCYLEGHAQPDLWICQTLPLCRQTHKFRLQAQYVDNPSRRPYTSHQLSTKYSRPVWKHCYSIYQIVSISLTLSLTHAGSWSQEIFQTNLRRFVIAVFVGMALSTNRN